MRIEILPLDYGRDAPLSSVVCRWAGARDHGRSAGQYFVRRTPRPSRPKEWLEPVPLFYATDIHGSEYLPKFVNAGKSTKRMPS
jgi:hypothetical protein